MGDEYYSDDDCVAAGEYLADFNLQESFEAAKECVGADSLETIAQEFIDQNKRGIKQFVNGDDAMKVADEMTSGTPS